MKVTDIDYDSFQDLLRKAKAFDDGLLDKAKFISVGYHEYIRTDEIELLNSFRIVTERVEYYSLAINGYCNKNNIHFADFLDKYSSKKH